MDTFVRSPRSKFCHQHPKNVANFQLPTLRCYQHHCHQLFVMILLKIAIEINETSNKEHWKGAMATYQDGAVVIAGNANNEGSLEHYNPTLNQWTLESKTKAFHFYERFTAVPLDGTIYTFG